METPENEPFLGQPRQTSSDDKRPSTKAFMFVLSILIFFLYPLEESSESHFTCHDHCDCLPKPKENALYIHQSYKSANKSTWHAGWGFFQRSWKRLHPNWEYIFWTDKENELLARCMNYTEKYATLLRPIERADMARLLYLIRYGGLYADLDMIAVRNHESLLKKFRKTELLLQGEITHGLALEWAFARKANHPFLLECVNNYLHHVAIKWRWAAVHGTGPGMLAKCFKAYYHTEEIETMRPYEDLMVLSPNLVSPLNCDDWKSNLPCVSLRTKANKFWTKENWEECQCYKWLQKEGSYVFTTYTGSWIT